MSPTSQTCFGCNRILIWETTLGNCRDVSALLTLFYSSLHSWWTWQSPEAKFSVPWTFFLLEKLIMSSLWQVSGSKVLDLLRFGIMEFLTAHLSLVVCWVMLQGSGDNGPSTGIQSNSRASWETGCKCVNFVTMKLWRFWESTLTLSFWTDAPRTWNPPHVVKFPKDDKNVNNSPFCGCVLCMISKFASIFCQLFSLLVSPDLLQVQTCLYCLSTRNCVEVLRYSWWIIFFSWTALQARYKELHTTTKLHFAYDNFEQRVFEYLFFEPSAFKRHPKEKILEALLVGIKHKQYQACLCLILVPESYI
jgi:hypothetical protein